MTERTRYTNIIIGKPAPWYRKIINNEIIKRIKGKIKALISDLEFIFNENNLQLLFIIKTDNIIKKINT